MAEYTREEVLEQPPHVVVPGDDTESFQVGRREQIGLEHLAQLRAGVRP